MKIHKDCKIELAASKTRRYVITEPYLDMTRRAGHGRNKRRNYRRCPS